MEALPLPSCVRLVLVEGNVYVLIIDVDGWLPDGTAGVLRCYCRVDSTDWFFRL